MRYAEKIDEQWVYKTPKQFQQEHNASIPKDQLEAAGLYEVTVDPKPTITDTQIIETGPLVDAAGRPLQTWTVRDMTQEELDQANDNRKSATWAEYRRRVFDAMPTSAEAHFGLRLGMFSALRTQGSTVQEAMAASLLTQEDYQAIQDLIAWQEDMRQAAKAIYQSDLDLYDDANWLPVPQSVVDMMARAGFEEEGVIPTASKKSK